MRRCRVLVVLAVSATFAAVAPASLAATPAITSHFNMTAGKCPLYGDVRICSGEVPSFDGAKLDVDLTLPTRTASNAFGRLPLIIMLHGFSSGKQYWEHNTDAGDDRDLYHWNNHWFSKRGYYVLTYTARGFRSPSLGGNRPATPNGTSESLPNGTIRLKSREFEIRDTQWLAALAAKSFAIDPNRVAVTGNSYGAGESWLQASQATWWYPNFREKIRDPSSSLPILQLQAAVPKYGWTDLAYSLAPNGHGGGGEPYASIYDSSQGRSSSDTGDGNPVGVPKASYITGIVTRGEANGTFEKGLSTTLSSEGPINVEAWKTRVDAGDPYDVNGVEDPVVRQIRRGLTEFRGAYYQDEGWEAQRNGRKVAIFGIEGWTDDLFTSVESFRQFRYLKRLNPNWPVALALADVGHPRAQNPIATWHRLNDQANEFLSGQINGSHEQATTVYTEPTVCGTGDSQSADRFAAASPTALSAGSLSVNYTSNLTLAPGSGTGDPDGVATDPVITSQLPLFRSDPCRVSQAATWPGRFTALSTALPQTNTYVGLGYLVSRYSLLPVGGGAPNSAEINVRVWDVPPTGATVLITRGTYRFSVPAYNSSSGIVRIPLFGNHFKFPAGHKIRVDIAQVDEPTFRRSNELNVILDPPTLVLPTRESGERVLAGG